MPVVNGVVTVLPPPDGYVVDFENPQRQAVPQVYYVAGSGTFLGLLLMAQRLYTKAFLVGRLQWDDDMFATGSGGAHGWEIPVEKFNIFMMDVYLAAAIYTLCGSFAKVSLLIFYFRLSPQRWFKQAVWASLAIIAAYSVAIFFALVFACDPIAMSWDITITEGTCINRPSLYIAAAAANIISDLILFALPIPIVVKLQIPRRQKIGLFFIFAVGSLTVVTSVVRVSLLPAMLTSTDQSWVISWASLWIIVEANLIVICAALPTLRKFFRHVAPKIIGESTYGKGTKTMGRNGSKTVSRLTIGGTNGTRNRAEYSQFDLDNSAETFAMASVAPPSKQGAASTGVFEGDTTWDDDSSEKTIIRGKNIVQTKTVTVEYTTKK
ncbi:Satratoxin biosynthesis SC1 cluster protein 4 [Colletotrichum shisoi]|uniref:Satratoxin biosynthesis SC1 cluster protein 4 n=1 Tax=Colletotrichum shisoi TaxID=2078593 RepID=A0A5Q4BB63_9PEZI|nr:Satratoxin biosynthesis SC1 cluster protein 4 [Colletotrichum shisoi]